MSSKKLLVKLILLLTLFACNENNKVKIIYYPNKKVKVILKTEENNLTGRAVEYYSNGELKEIRYYKQGKSNGKCFQFNKNGILVTINNFVNDNEVGKSYYFNKKKGYLELLNLNDNKSNLIKQISFYSNGFVKEINYTIISKNDGLREFSSSITYKKDRSISKLKSNYVNFYLVEDSITFVPIGNNYKSIDSIFLAVVNDFSDMSLENPLFVKKMQLKRPIKISENDLTKEVNNYVIYYWYKFLGYPTRGVHYIQLNKNQSLPKNSLYSIYF